MPTISPTLLQVHKPTPAQGEVVGTRWSQERAAAEGAPSFMQAFQSAAAANDTQRVSEGKQQADAAEPREVRDQAVQPEANRVEQDVSDVTPPEQSIPATAQSENKASSSFGSADDEGASAPVAQSTVQPQGAPTITVGGPKPTVLPPQMQVNAAAPPVQTAEAQPQTSHVQTAQPASTPTQAVAMPVTEPTIVQADALPSTPDNAPTISNAATAPSPGEQNAATGDRAEPSAAISNAALMHTAQNDAAPVRNDSQHIPASSDDVPRPAQSNVSVAHPHASQENTANASPAAAMNDASVEKNQSASVVKEQPGASRDVERPSAASGGTARVIAAESEPAISPAQARAAQVDAALRLEQATGQPAGAEQQVRIEAPSAQQHTQSDLSNGRANHSIAPQWMHADDADAPEPQFSNQVVRGLTAMLNQRGGVMTMRLDPPELGALRVQMTLARGTVSAEFHAATQQTQALIEKNLMTLRGALESQGLTVDRLVVHMPSAGQHQMMRDDSGNSQQHSPFDGRQDAAEGESRGRRDGDGDGVRARFEHRRAAFAKLLKSDALAFAEEDGG